MSKIEGLKAVRQHLTLYRSAVVRGLLYREIEPESRARRLTQLGEYTLLLEEIKDHLHNLSDIVVACRHGLAGTEPAGYDPWGGGDYDEARPYNPYEEIAECLQSGCSVSVLTLSPELLGYIESLPDAERRTSVFLLGFFGKAPWQRDTETGKLRALTDEETARWPESSMMESMEQNFFALTYAEEMAHALTLTNERADLQLILDLTL